MKRLLNIIAILLIIISLGLMGTGIYLDSVYKKDKPIKESKIEEIKTHIDIKDQEEKEIKKEELPPKREVIDKKEPEKEIVKEQETNKSPKVEIKIEEQQEAKIENKPYIDLLISANDTLRKEIKQRFGISVIYGEETPKGEIGGTGVSAYQLTNTSTINTALNTLYNSLKVYPEGIFKELGEIIEGKIALVDGFSKPGVTGCTTTNMRLSIIYISTKYQITETLFHESFHYMENCILRKGATFASWNTLNKEGFNYQTIDGTLSFDKTNDPNAYFANNYGQTMAQEDRATIFELMMQNNHPSCLTVGTPIHTKARTIAKNLEEFLNSVSQNNTEYWERYL